MHTDSEHCILVLIAPFVETWHNQGIKCNFFNAFTQSSAIPQLYALGNSGA